jgi:deoxyguanosine kinase
MYNYIAIEGNIGAGKTSLTRMIAEEYNANIILERFEDNSFLPKFYKDPVTYAFPLETSFLADRYQQLKDQLTHRDLFKTFTIADYFLDKSVIFARNNLQADEFALFSRLFTIINPSLPRPELLVYLYLDIPNLLQNIHKRGRDYEQSIQQAYLEKIQAGYLNYFRHMKESRILIVNTNRIDFVNNPEHYRQLTDVIDSQYDPGIHRIDL